MSVNLNTIHSRAGLMIATSKVQIFLAGKIEFTLKGPLQAASSGRERVQEACNGLPLVSSGSVLT